MNARATTPDTVVRLLQLHAQDPAADSLDQDTLDALHWPELISFSSAHFVLQAMAQPLRAAGFASEIPDNIADFLDSVETANAQRNDMLRDRLLDISASLDSIDVLPVALKGAVFLLEENPDTNTSWRFMSDLDLLVPSHRLTDCVKLLRRDGYRPVTTDYDPEREAHYPPLISPCGMFSIELHTRLFAFGDHGLPARDVFKYASNPESLAQHILVPSFAHRLHHLIAHAQLHNRNHATGRIVLKDFLDLTMLESLKEDGIDWDAAINAFPSKFEKQAAVDFIEAWRLSIPQSDESATSFLEKNNSWARRAISKLHQPAWLRRLMIPLDLVRLETFRLRREAGHVSRRLALLSSPAKLKSASDVWSGKLRQRLWS